MAIKLSAVSFAGRAQKRIIKIATTIRKECIYERRYDRFYSTKPYKSD